MKYRRRIGFFALMLLSALCMTAVSCVPKTIDPLSYQCVPAEITAALTTDTGTFGVVINISGNGAARHAVISFTSPDTVAGMTVDIRGVDSPSVTISSGDITLPVSTSAAERFIYIADMFRLDSSMVSSAAENGNSVTVTVPHPCGGSVYVSFDGGSDTPSMISDADGTVSLSIANYRFTTEGNE